MTRVACHSVRRSPSLPGVSTRKTFETRPHLISTLLGKSLVQDRHLLPATVIAWQIKLTRIQMVFLGSHQGESELTLESTGKYANGSSPVPCQPFNTMKQDP
ncbi:hypothetical protein PVAP13_2NG337403 [Panicum virgatum]|uniref:Uncharacterized protein n=1 Tax=Panicum virgatum TaxID=38727 RepID=A0A8T0VNR2_PANVG|nr:hypothetical protein PVAP13_2NG337403 [Panicum virgatum]